MLFLYFSSFHHHIFYHYYLLKPFCSVVARLGKPFGGKSLRSGKIAKRIDTSVKGMNDTLIYRLNVESLYLLMSKRRLL